MTILHSGLTGVLRRWNHERKFGFLHIESDEHLKNQHPSGVFVHRRELPDPPYCDGDQYTFDIWLDEEKQKPECCNVVLIQSNKLQVATIVKWNDEKGFGFAEAADGTQVFVHTKMVKSAPVHENMKVSLNYRENPRRRGQYEARTIKLDDGHAGYQKDDQSFNERPRGSGGGYNRRGGGRGGRRDGRSRGRGRNRERDYDRGSGRAPNANGWISTDVIKTPKWGSEPSHQGGGSSSWLPKPGNPESGHGASGGNRPAEQKSYSNEAPYPNPYQSNQGSYDSNPNPYQPTTQNSYQTNPYQAPTGPPGPYQPEQNSYQSYQQQGSYQQGAYPASGTNTYQQQPW